jgi:lipopolysaccharide transport system permease protein
MNILATIGLQRWAKRHSAFYLLSHGGLLCRITATELASRYAGTVLGFAWALLAPLLILTLYTVTYTMILRVQVQELSPLQYTLFIFAGLVPFLSTAEALTLGVSSIVANRTLLTNTIFPIDLAPVKAVLLSQVVMVVGMLTLVAGMGIAGQLQATVILLPIVWALQLFAVTGIVWFLSLLNVVLRDLQMLLAVLIMALMIASPIAYAPANVPPGLRFLVILNPFAWFVVAYQKILVFGQWLSILDWLGLVCCAALLFGAGGYFFSCMKKAIIDHV